MTVFKRFPLFLAGLMLLAGGCAKTGDPLPPRVQLPATINDLQVQREGTEALIRFRVPPGSDWIEIYRQCDPRTETDRMQLIVRLGPDELVESNRMDSFLYRDASLPGSARDCRYALRFVDSRGLRSDYSNFASFPPP